MPHHKSAAKRVITNEKARQRNIARRNLGDGGSFVGPPLRLNKLLNFDQGLLP